MIDEFADLVLFSEDTAEKVTGQRPHCIVHLATAFVAFTDYFCTLLNSKLPEYAEGLLLDKVLATTRSIIS